MTPDRHARSILPIPHRTPPGLTTYDAKDPATSFPPIEPLRPPDGAPNVLIVLLDDVGFGASGVFGGPCHTPTAERLAASGLRYNRFHTKALCAPTRQALLTGRNHHSVGMGSITETATSAPGQSYHDGTEVGRGRVEATQPMVFSADETTDIGYESGTTVSSDYSAHTSRFTGKSHRVQLDTGIDDHDHHIDPEERLRVAMARQ